MFIWGRGGGSFREYIIWLWLSCGLISRGVYSFLAILTPQQLSKSASRGSFALRNQSRGSMQVMDGGVGSSISLPLIACDDMPSFRWRKQCIFTNLERTEEPQHAPCLVLFGHLHRPVQTEDRALHAQYAGVRPRLCAIRARLGTINTGVNFGQIQSYLFFFLISIYYTISDGSAHSPPLFLFFP